MGGRLSLHTSSQVALQRVIFSALTKGKKECSKVYAHDTRLCEKQVV